MNTMRTLLIIVTKTFLDAQRPFFFGKTEDGEHVFAPLDRGRKHSQTADGVWFSDELRTIAVQCGDKLISRCFQTEKGLRAQFWDIVKNEIDGFKPARVTEVGEHGRQFTCELVATGTRVICPTNHGRRVVTQRYGISISREILRSAPGVGSLVLIRTGAKSKRGLAKTWCCAERNDNGNVIAINPRTERSRRRDRTARADRVAKRLKDQRIYAQQTSARVAAEKALGKKAGKEKKAGKASKPSKADRRAARQKVAA